MAIPTVFAPVKRDDFTLRPFQVHKQYRLSSVDLVDSSSGYNIVDAIHTSLKTPIGSDRVSNDPTNSWDGSYQHVIWQAYNHLYYKFPYDPYATLEHSNKRYTYKFLNYSASVFSIPAMDFGERVKPGSVIVSNSSHAFTLVDDNNGNLYDPSINTGSFSKRYGLVGYWGFNDVFKRFKYRDGTITRGSIGYESRVFEPDDMSHCRNVSFTPGVTINTSGSGMAANFTGQSLMLTHDRPEFNFTANEDFTIAFWIKAPISQSVLTSTRNSIISKRGVKREVVYGENLKYNQNDLLISAPHYSSSIANSSTDVYPYHFEIINQSDTGSQGILVFKVSNGVQTVSFNSLSNINDGTYRHIAVTKNGTTLSFYRDGTFVNDTICDLGHCINNNALLFGADNLDYSNGFSGSLDELRFYDYALTDSEIATLADNSNMSMYQTAVVGNVFYRQGNIVITPFDPKYLNAFKNTWNVTYKGTHTIYQYEVLCRVKKGSFNLTYNPTARISPKSDLLTDDMTGSLLLPYATTIGMYNDTGELVAVAKFGQPIQMRDDVDLNFLVRWDA